MAKQKTKRKKQHHPVTIRDERQFDMMHPIWDFSNTDNDGEFAFNIHRKDIDLELIFDKLLQYSRRTWLDIKQDTHDESNKSKHHPLDYDGISKEGKRRIRVKNIQSSDYDAIFSFSLTNKVRLIGLKFDQRFQVIWYDKGHGFYPVKS